MFSGAGPHTATTVGDGGSPSDRGSAVPSASAPISTPASESIVAFSFNGLGIQGDDGTPPPQPASESGVTGHLNRLDSQGDDGMPSSQSQPAASKKKKRGARAVGPDKNGRGLRQFSMRVCEKVESKGTTTYNEVADELVAEFSNPNINIDSAERDNPSALPYDEKNIRRRVYDALNVLRAMEIISKDKKEIHWRGLPKTNMNDIEELKTEVIGLKDRIEKKNAYLKDLEEQNLVQRNQKLYGSGDEPSSGLALPFTLVHQERHGNLEVEMSDDSQIVHLDFISTPFQLQDETDVMKAMGLCGNKETDCIKAPVANGGECSSTPSNYLGQSLQPPGPRGVWVPNSHPTPGILKGHAKHKHKE